MIENESRPNARPQLPVPPRVDVAPMPGPEVLVVKDALTAAMCAQLLRPPADYKGRHLDTRDPALTPIIDAVDALVERVDAEQFGGVRPTVGERRLLGYRAGDYMAAHRDNEYEGAMFGGRRHPVPRVPFGLCLYLDAPGSYGGGAVLVDGHPPIHPPRGAAVFVRGDVLHHVQKVTSGHRTILKVIATVPAEPRWRFHNATASWSPVRTKRKPSSTCSHLGQNFDLTKQNGPPPK